jgi:hypothetical protein
MHREPRMSTGRIQVIHVNVGPDREGGARALVANVLERNGPDGGGYHWVHDNRESIRTASDNQLVYGAKGGSANALGLHYCIIGSPDQTAADWTDAYSIAAIEQCAKQVAADALAKNLPIEHRPGEFYGQCGHHDVTIAFKVRGGHYDPGPNFPWPLFMDRVRVHAALKLVAPKPKGAKPVVIFTNPEHKAPDGTPSYYVVKDGGSVHPYAAPFFGDLNGIPLAAPIVSGCCTPSGNGYLLLGADGGVFAFGDAKSYGKA